MPLTNPFAALRPDPQRASEVAAPPYDVVSLAEARAEIEKRPLSFLRVSRPEATLAENIDAYDDRVYARAAQNMAAMQRDGLLRPDPTPGLYVYRMTLGERTQTGVAAAVSIAAYDDGRVRKHELTQPGKETDRVRQIQALNAHTGPVMLTVRHDDRLRDILASVSCTPPNTAVELHQVRHEIWVVDDESLISRISERFEAAAVLYIADGHHRSAAASRVAATYSGANPMAQNFLGVIFPEDEVEILDYNRVIRDLGELDRDQFLRRLGECGDLTRVDGAHRPTAAHEFGVFVGGAWYVLSLPRGRRGDGDPASRIGASLLTEHVLSPVLGIDDLRRDPRVGFVGGRRGLEGLQAAVDSGEMAAAFAVFPTRMADLLAVADANGLMPPKSTWFEPKLADGLISLPF